MSSPDTAPRPSPTPPRHPDDFRLNTATTKRRRRLSDDMSIGDNSPPPPSRRVRFKSPTREAPAADRKRQRSMDETMSSLETVQDSPSDSAEATTALPLAPTVTKRSRPGTLSDPAQLLRHLDHDTLLHILASILTRHPHLIQSELPRLLPTAPTLHASLMRLKQLRDAALAAFPYSATGQSRDAYALSRVRQPLEDLYAGIRHDAAWLLASPPSQDAGERLAYLDQILQCIEQVPEGRWESSAYSAEEARWSLWSDMARTYASPLIISAGLEARQRHATPQPVLRADVWRWAEWVARWNAVSGEALQSAVVTFQAELGWVMRGQAAPSTAPAASTPSPPQPTVA